MVLNGWESYFQKLLMDERHEKIEQECGKQDDSEIEENEERSMLYFQ
jgi:hypothetical protein